MTNALFFLFILVFFFFEQRRFLSSSLCLLLPSSSSSSLQSKYGGFTALMNAAMNGHDTVIALLLEADAQIDAQDNDGWTPLIYASIWGKEAAVRELLKGDANLDLKYNGKTALDYARERNHQSIVDLLVDHKRS